jgi:hypothetical protein
MTALARTIIEKILVVHQKQVEFYKVEPVEVLRTPLPCSVVVRGQDSHPAEGGNP